MIILLSHPTGNANVKAIAACLESNGILYEFNTSIASFPNNIWYRLGGIKGLSDFRRRSYSALLQPFTICHPYRELGRVFANKFGYNSLIKHETGIFSIDKIYNNFDKMVSKRLCNAKVNGISTVYAYEDGALASFRVAKKLGIKCIYDLPIAYWETMRKLMIEEAERLPNWAITLKGGILDSEKKLARKTEELELADLVVTPSSFVKNSLPQWASKKKLIISPFGSPTSDGYFNIPLESGKSIANKKLRVLFVGSMGQRKGLADLFAAINLLNNPNIELVVMGSLLEPLSFYKTECKYFIYEPGRSHLEVLKLMRSCNVFCLPSIVEGRALVMQEAMSQGLPLIITPNTGGEDLIIEGKTGFLVPIRSPEIIAEKLQWFLDNKFVIPEMGIHAMEHAKNYSWEKYSNTIIHALNES
jgi:glycosyltransferase involved in cell wall biosynthesis